MWIKRMLFALLTCYWTCVTECAVTLKTVLPEIQSRCNPYVDMIFVLDKSTNITESQFNIQKNFVRQLLRDHKAPVGAVRVAIVVCGDNSTMVSPFTDDISPSSDIFQQTSASYDIDYNRHCLENINLKFKTKSREGVARQAVLLKGDWNWNVEDTKVFASAAKDSKTVMIVIAIGVKEFNSLSALQGLATGDATYFVLSTFQNLRDLATVLSKDTCKPISLDLTSETRDKQPSTSTTVKPLLQRERCIRLSASMFKRYIPGFGYTRLECSSLHTLDMDTCSCV